MTTLGKYTGHNTVFHRMDSRIKLIGLILFMVSVFLSYGTSYMDLVVFGGLFVILFVISLFAKASFLTLFKSLKALWVMIVFLLIINIFLSNDKESLILFTIPIGNGVDIRLQAVINVSYIFIRLVLVMMMTNILTATTKPMDLTNALEWIFFPLSLIKIPIHKFAMAISLALRFVPTLQEETSRIMNAQASRGVDFRHGKIKEKLKSLISLIIPLFMSAFLTSGELADAMEARGYDPDAKRTKFKTNHWGVIDTLGVIFLMAFLSGMVVLAYYKFDLFDYLGVELPKLK